MISIDLSGKIALVTGGGQGLGQATARLLHEAGATVVVNYLDDDTGTARARAVQTVTPFGNRGLAVAADVRSRTDLQALMQQIQEHFGALDLLINNAAIPRDRTLKNLSDEDWDAVMETNLSAVFRVCQSALPLLRDGGRIVNLASISAVIGFFGQANYAAAKAGVAGMTRALAREIGSRNITVNCVAPGFIDTDMTRALSEDQQNSLKANIPLARLGTPEDVAQAVAFLASPAGAYITGNTLHVNGGLYLA